MRLYYMLFFLCFSLCSYSQGVNKILVIDTVNGSIRDFKITLNNPIDSTLLDIIPELSDSRCKYEYRVKANIDSNHYPNLQTSIRALSPKSTLVFSLDDSGGTLSLDGAFLSQLDTIRISKFTIYHNCLPDTVKTWMGWYKRFQSDTGSGLKELSVRTYPDKVGESPCSASYPSVIDLKINGKRYVTALKTVSENREVIWYHGHKKMGRWAERRYEKRRYSGKSYKYFARCVRISKGVLFAEIVIE